MEPVADYRLPYRSWFSLIAHVAARNAHDQLESPPAAAFVSVVGGDSRRRFMVAFARSATGVASITMWTRPAGRRTRVLHSVREVLY